jgi:hypothetical protein
MNSQSVERRSVSASIMPAICAHPRLHGSKRNGNGLNKVEA